jgi:hypothetical protein
METGTQTCIEGNLWRAALAALEARVAVLEGGKTPELKTSVFIVLNRVDNEGDEFVGVYAKQEDAQRVVTLHNYQDGSQSEWYRVEEHFVK